MAIERWRPFGSSVLDTGRTLAEIQGEMNRLFDTVFGRPTVGMPVASPRLWVPLADVWETKDDIVMHFELPGVSEKDISLSVTGDVLTVRGERQFDKAAKDEDYHQVERVYGKFERTIRLPMPVQADKVKAKYRDGVLEVRLPKAEEVKPREIKIEIL